MASLSRSACIMSSSLKVTTPVTATSIFPVKATFPGFNSGSEHKLKNARNWKAPISLPLIPTLKAPLPAGAPKICSGICVGTHVRYMHIGTPKTETFNS